MSREIKFRAFYKGERFDFVELTSYKDGSLGISVARSGFSDLVSAPDEVVLSQYTGLKDKNGTDIYEDDVLEITDIEKGGESEYSFIGGFVDYVEEKSSYWVGYGLLSDHNKNSKVIGNIHNNPELLNN